MKYPWALPYFLIDVLPRTVIQPMLISAATLICSQSRVPTRWSRLSPAPRLRKNLIKETRHPAPLPAGQPTQSTTALPPFLLLPQGSSIGHSGKAGGVQTRLVFSNDRHFEENPHMGSTLYHLGN